MLQDRLISQIMYYEDILTNLFEQLEQQLNMRISIKNEISKAREEIHCLKIMNEVHNQQQKNIILKKKTFMRTTSTQLQQQSNSIKRLKEQQSVATHKSILQDSQQSVKTMGNHKLFDEVSTNK